MLQHLNKISFKLVDLPSIIIHLLKYYNKINIKHNQENKKVHNIHKRKNYSKNQKNSL